MTSPADEPATEMGPDGRFTPESVLALKRAAAAGHVRSMANLGTVAYQEGDLNLAISWSERAWAAGDLMAGFNLGVCHAAAGDTHRADLVWQKAAALGDADAMMSVARLALYRDDPAVAESWLKPVLAQSQPYPITALGVAFRDYGDETTALTLFERAIALGDGYAMEFAAVIHQMHGDLDTATRLRREAVTATKFGLGRFTL